MGLSHQHELHRRRLSRNIGVGAVLFAFVAIIFALSIVKVTYQGPEADAGHSASHSAAPAAGGGQ